MTKREEALHGLRNAKSWEALERAVAIFERAVRDEEARDIAAELNRRGWDPIINGASAGDIIRTRIAARAK